MNFTRSGRVAAIAIAGTVLLSSCASNEAPSASGGATTPDSSLSGELVGIGASSQAAAQTAWGTAFQIANSDVTVNYDSAGSGAGRTAFLEGGAAFVGSDRAFNDEEIAAGGFGACATDSGVVELPLYISPIALIFNLDGVDSLNMDAATVANIFTGEITSWDDPAITELNPDAALPSTAITAVHRADNSGTTENLTDYLHVVAPEAWPADPSGDWPTDYSGEAATGTSGMVDTVSGGEGTFGYADASRAGGLGTVAIQVGDDFVPFSAEAAAAVIDDSELVSGRESFDLAYELNRTTTAPGAYPIVLISYLIACEQYDDADTASLVSAYLTYIASPEGQDAAAEEAGSAPISSSLFESVQAAIAVIS